MGKKQDKKIKKVETEEIDSNEHLIKIEGDIHVFQDNDELNTILDNFYKTLGNKEPWKQQVVFYFQCKEKFKDLPLQEIVEKDYIHLIVGMKKPLNPNTLIFAMPIAFKKEILEFSQEDYNMVCNLIDTEFPTQLDVWLEKNGKPKDKTESKSDGTED